jgi:hypothetical protein
MARSGGIAVVRSGLANADHGAHGAIRVPLLVDLDADLPSDTETLRAQLLTSTTREDFRRIRRAGFTYRITTDRDVVRQFHAQHYKPLVEHRFPDDGTVRSVERMLGDLGRGGELICADIDGDWVAGIFNVAGDSAYALGGLGIRDADDSIRHTRVTAALVVRSLERAVELGVGSASLGRSLPFLGKGPIWFKTKWGAALTLGRTTHLLAFMDLRHAPVRRVLSTTPIVHVVNGELVASMWLEPGERALRSIISDVDRFRGLRSWNVLGLPETLASAAEEISDNDRLNGFAVTAHGDPPIWLGGVLSQRQP